MPNSLISSLHGPLQPMDYSLTVNRVIANGSWNLSSIPYPILTKIKNQIHDNPIPSSFLTSNQPNTLFWTLSNNNNSTTNSCYNALRSIDFVPCTENLSWLWKVRVPHKMNVFLWLCWHNRIKSNALLHRRGMPISPNCNLWSQDAETTKHILRTCKQAQRKSIYLIAPRSKFGYKETLKITLSSSSTSLRTPFLPSVAGCYGRIAIKDKFSWNPLNHILFTKFLVYQLNLSISLPNILLWWNNA